MNTNTLQFVVTLLALCTSTITIVHSSTLKYSPIATSEMLDEHTAAHSITAVCLHSSSTLESTHTYTLLVLVYSPSPPRTCTSSSSNNNVAFARSSPHVSVAMVWT